MVHVSTTQVPCVSLACTLCVPRVNLTCSSMDNIKLLLGGNVPGHKATSYYFAAIAANMDKHSIYDAILYSK